MVAKKSNVKKSGTKKPNTQSVKVKNVSTKETKIDTEVIEDDLEEDSSYNKKIFSITVIFLIVAVLVFLVVSYITNNGDKYNYSVKKIAGKTVYTIEGESYVESEEATDLVKIDIKSYGIIIAELYPDMAPITVNNFKELVGKKFYDGLIFHRVIKDFMIQTGDPNGTGTGGSGVTIKGEFSQNGVDNDLTHKRGVLSMARKTGNPDTEDDMNSTSSQFFIVQKDSDHLDGKYAAFGFVIHGIDLVDQIAEVKVDSLDKPINKVVIRNIRFVEPYEGEK